MLKTTCTAIIHKLAGQITDADCIKTSITVTPACRPIQYCSQAKISTNSRNFWLTNSNTYKYKTKNLTRQEISQQMWLQK
jgi:hypothetical protein